MRLFRTIPIVFWLLSLIGSAVEAIGQVAPVLIITDRPDFTESGVSVPVGKVQVEGGIGWANQASVGGVSLPDMLIRIGIVRGLEVRLGVPDYQSSEFLEGYGNASLGGKLDINNLIAGWETAVIAMLELPTGAEGVGSEHASGEVILAGGTDINSVYSLGSQVMVGVTGTDDGADFVFGGTVVVGRSITEALGSFLELATLIHDTDGTAVLLHGGLTYVLRNNLQLDFHGAVGLTADSPDSLIGAGFAIIL
jgi:Putative MetA-pathway of phenol degradation